MRSLHAGVPHACLANQETRGARGAVPSITGRRHNVGQLTVKCGTNLSPPKSGLPKAAPPPPRMIQGQPQKQELIMLGKKKRWKHIRTVVYGWMDEYGASKINKWVQT